MGDLIVILGGLGFIGSNIANYFADKHDVLVLDNLDIHCGGAPNFVGNNIRHIYADINKLAFLERELSRAVFIIDAVGWTDHAGGQNNPALDRALNFGVHAGFLELLTKIDLDDRLRLVYLGSSGQFGNAPKDLIVGPGTPMRPIDFQGVHKTATENYFRSYCKILGRPTVSLRLPGVFGPNMFKAGKELGLVGSLIKEAGNEGRITIFGDKRSRCLTGITYVVSIIDRLYRANWAGFVDVDSGGISIYIDDLAMRICSLWHPEDIEIKVEQEGKLPVADTLPTRFDLSPLKTLIGSLPPQCFGKDLAEAIADFRGMGI